MEKGMDRDTFGRSQWISGGLSRDAIKCIAVAAMILDHIGVAVVAPWMQIHAADAESWMFWSRVYAVLRTLGRIAFPIFAYFLVEGFFYSSNRKRYLERLLTAALVSEIPFDLAASGKVLEFGHQNTLFTLALGLVMLMLLARCGKKNALITPVIVGGTMVLARVLHVDYQMEGILLIAVFYLFYYEKKMCFLMAGILSFVGSVNRFGAAALAYVPLAFYDRTKKSDKRISRLFYLVYPVHLVVLYGVRMLLM